MGLKIRGEGDEDAPLFVTGLFNATSNTESVMDTVMDTVTDGVTDESTGGDGSDGYDSKTYNLLNVETKLAQVEQYTTAMETELKEKEDLAQKPSPASPEQAQSTDSDKSQVNSNESKKLSQSVTKEKDKGLKVGDQAEPGTA